MRVYNMEEASPEQTVPAPKRQLTEAQLRALAKGRKTSLEARKKRSLLRSEEKLRAKAAFDAEWVAAKNRAMGIVEPHAPVQEAAPDVPATREPPRKPEKARKAPMVLHDPPESHDDFEEHQSEPEAKPLPRAPKNSREVPDYKQAYYKAKLDLLHQQHQRQQQEHDHLSSYGRAPAQVHAYDIARQTLRSKANDLVYRQAYASLFPNG